MNRSRFGILIPFSISVTMYRITRLLFATTSNSFLSISIALCYTSIIAYTSMDCCTSTYTLVDSCISASTTFSSPTSFCVIYVSTKCCSIASSSFDSSMNTRSINVVLGFVFSLTCKRLMLLH